jgi:SpoIID/LytB domain protein
VLATSTRGVTTGKVTITGAGFGHGVGMSQYGARGQAEAGRSASQILRHYYSGTTVTGYPDRMDLRVNVVHRGTLIRLDTTPLASGGGRIVLVPAGAPKVSVPPGGSVAVTPAGTRVSAVVRSDGATRTITAPSLVVRWSGGRGVSGPATTLDVASTTRAGSTAVAKSRRYRWGSLDIRPYGSRLEAVAVVDLHGEYLRGIAEVPSSWPVAALETQVVAARNYALAAHAAGTRASCGDCHLWDDTRSQVYSGWAKEAPRIGARWVAAVRATQVSSTKGLTVLYAGKPITAYYSSSSGGRTRDVSQVWGGSVPYLRSVADPWSVDASNNPSFASWSRSVPVSKVLRAFGLHDLTSLRVSARDRSGAATTVVARSSSGHAVALSGARLRARLGLPSDWFRGFTLPTAAAPKPLTPNASAASARSPSAAASLASRASPPRSMIPAGLPSVYWRSGSATLNGKAWRTSCRRSASGTYRCVASVRTSVYRKNSRGLWGPTVAWVPDSVSFYARDSAWWSRYARAKPGTYDASGYHLRTSCTPSRGRGPRVCTTWVLTTRVARRPNGHGGYFYYRVSVWDINSRVGLTRA